MRQVREVLRLKYERGESGREIARSVGISRYKVLNICAAVVGISWPIPPELDDAALEQTLFDPRRGTVAAEQCKQPDWARVHIERRRSGASAFQPARQSFL
jgi:hypothetical protein